MHGRVRHFAGDKRRDDPEEQESCGGCADQRENGHPWHEQHAEQQRDEDRRHEEPVLRQRFELHDHRLAPDPDCVTVTAMPLKLLITFAAGLVSFLSPCVLPLLPGYAGYMSGGSAGERVPVRKALPGTLAFVAGLTVVFVSLGAAASVLSSVLNDHKRTLELASGAFVIALGLFMTLRGRVPFLLRERRFAVRPGVGAARTFALGAAFAFGWTPCIGPTLGAALNLAATTTGLRTGITLLLFYSLGLGVPFILVGLGLVSFGGRLKRHSGTIQTIGGVVLVFVGVLMVTGQLTLITIWMRRVFSHLGLDLWSRV